MFIKSVAALTFVAATAAGLVPFGPFPTPAPYVPCAFVTKEQLETVNAKFPGGARDLCTVDHAAALLTDQDEIAGMFTCGLANGTSSEKDPAENRASCEKAEYGKMVVKNCVYVVADGADSGDCLPHSAAKFLKTKAGQQQKKCDAIGSEVECSRDADCTWALDDANNIHITNDDTKSVEAPTGECKGKLFAARMTDCAVKTRDECSSASLITGVFAALASLIAALLL